MGMEPFSRMGILNTLYCAIVGGSAKIIITFVRYPANSLYCSLWKFSSLEGDEVKFSINSVVFRKKLRHISKNNEK